MRNNNWVVTCLALINYDSFLQRPNFFYSIRQIFLLCADFTDLYQISEFYLRFQMRITIWWHFWLSRKPFNGILPNNWSWVTTDEHLIDIIWNALLANGLNSELNGARFTFFGNFCLNLRLLQEFAHGIHHAWTAKTPVKGWFSLKRRKMTFWNENVILSNNK